MARFPRRVARALLSVEERRRLASIVLDDAGYGYDALGMHPEWVAMAAAAFRPFYERYHRVRSHGAEHLPRQGAAILAANHSGTIPIDATMLYLDVLANTDPPRVPRPVGDLFLPKLPFLGTLFSRVGMVAGSRGNVRHLLAAGELLMIFPEGTPGIGKGFAERYRLRPFRPGHAELAIRHRVPVIPVGIVGAEEALIQVAKLESLHPFGAPYLPITATPFPLPTRFHIHYGEPLVLHEGLEPEAADDAVTVRAAAARVQAAVQGLLDRGLEARGGVFR